MMHPLETIKQRRAALTATANPRTGLDYVVTLSGRFGAKSWSEPITAGLRYVPDDLVIAPAALQTYLDLLESTEWETLEELAASVAGDIDAELLPRWMRVRLHTQVSNDEHRVDIEQTKPGWDNRMLLARLRID